MPWYPPSLTQYYELLGRSGFKESGKVAACRRQKENVISEYENLFSIFTIILSLKQVKI
jgi:hypothetical protein